MLVQLLDRYRHKLNLWRIDAKAEASQTRR
jgi:hypothetical protein